MKKIYSLVMLAAAMAVASCATEPVETVALPGAEVEVSLTTELPSLGSRSIADGNTVDEVHYGIYANGDLLEEISGTVAMSNGTATISTRLVSGKTYTFVFWAQNSNNGHYTVTLADNTASVAVDYTGVEANNEKLDAFFLCKDYTVSGPVNETFTLYRPFAQLNYATTDADIAAAKSAGVELSQSSLVVDAYTGLDLFTGAVSGKQEQVAFALANVPSLTEEKLLTNGAEYRYVATTYTLVNEKELSAISATLVCNDGTTQTISYPSAYLKRNYRTNVLGNLLTDAANITVVVEEEFTDDLPDTDIEKLKMAAYLGGTVVLNSDVTLTEPLVVKKGVEMVLVLNGHTISQEQAQSGAYSMIQNNGTLVIKNNVSRATTEGTIKYGDTAALTSSVNYFSNVIENNGYLTVEEGVNLVNNSCTAVAAHGYPHVIDNRCNNLTINGGTLTNAADYATVRIWCTEDTNTAVTINGGTFNGSIDFQTVNARANKGTLTINGGTFNADSYTGCAVRLLGFGEDVDEMIAYLNGGTFNGLVIRKKFASVVEFNSQVFYVSGGVYANDVTEFATAGVKVVENNGKFYVVAESTDAVATSKTDLEAALSSGDTEIYLVAGEYTMPAAGNFSAGDVVTCAPGTVFTGSSNANINGATVVGATFSNPTGTVVTSTINGTFKDCTFEGQNGTRWAYAGETVVFENCVFSGSTYGVHFDGGATNYVTFRNCTISGFNALAGNITMATFEGCTFVGNGKSGYNGANLWGSAKMINCEFTFDGTTANEWIDCIGADKTYEFENCTVNGVAYTSSNYADFGENIFSRNHVVVKVNGVDCQF